MRYYWRQYIMLVVLFLFQIGFLAAWRPAGVVPNLILVAIVWLGLLERSYIRVAWTAIICGLMVGVANNGNLAIEISSLFLAAWTSILISRAGLGVNDRWQALAAVLVGSIVISISVWLSLVGTVAIAEIGYPAKLFMTQIIFNLALVPVLRSLTSWSVRGGRAHD